MVTRYEEDFKKSIMEMVKTCGGVAGKTLVLRGRSIVLPIIHKNLVQGHHIIRVLSALKIPMSTYSDWLH